MSETRDARHDYFEYLENVLGIKTILQPKDLADKSAFAVTELLFVVQDYASYSAEELDLLSKMIAAVKVDPSRLKVCDLREAQNFQTQCLVIFQDQTQTPPIQAILCIQTFSPRVLLKKPELKKVAWTELQKVLQHFS
jgi:hypothetical protein